MREYKRAKKKDGDDGYNDDDLKLLEQQLAKYFDDKFTKNIQIQHPIWNHPPKTMVAHLYAPGALLSFPIKKVAISTVSSTNRVANEEYNGHEVEALIGTAIWFWSWIVFQL